MGEIQTAKGYKHTAFGTNEFVTTLAKGKDYY
jgi:hypothetical protein